MTLPLYLLLFVMGLAGGFLAGLIGIGGGVMYVLILPYMLGIMGFPEEAIVQLTIANSIFGTMFAALAGNIALWRKREFYWKEVVVMGSFATLVGLLLLHYFVNTPAYQKTEFNLIVILLMIGIIWRTLRQARREESNNSERKVGLLGSGFVGASAGAVAALSGLGGGTIIIPILNSGFQMTMQKAKSISLGVIFITAFCITLLNTFSSTGYSSQWHTTGYIVWPLALTISMGVVIASPLGVLVARKMSSRTISYIFVLFVMVVIADKLIQLL
ncbi:sulfite exporter TauE/SafE family protein [Roseivirga thermotolerans]|uniref:sulfite exporter TauE/SafE family protein n=1 Tax=Roseivirga thermotolerans TaxID=1758176 RepID=UPI00273E6415|nr:sulfite exporter TauE/SafE family protein [Roseivirga thermotolerans]